MKILYITHYAGLGGANNALLHLSHSLKEMGHECVILFPKDGAAVTAAEDLGLSTKIIKNIQWAGPIEKGLHYRLRLLHIMQINAFALRELIPYIRSEGFDLIHTNTSLPYIGALAARKLSIPHIWHVRENLSFYGYDYMYGASYARKLYSEASAVIAISAYIKDYLENKYGVTGNVHVVYDGIPDMPEITPVPDPDGRFRLMYAGGISEGKGVRDVLKASEILKNRGYSDRIRIKMNLGRRDAHRDIWDFFEDRGLSEIVATGDYGDMRDERTHFDCALMCSKDEAFGLVTSESMRDGLMVIGADSGATPELITDGETGLLYTQGSPESLADRIIYAMEHPEIREPIIRNARARFIENYTDTINRDSVLSLYRKALEGK